MLTVCSFLWSDPTHQNAAYYTYTDDHVRILRAMVAKHLSVPHRFVCVSDHDIPGMDTVELDTTTHVPGTRFAKLMLFRPDAAAILGARILYLDLDCVVTGNLDPLVERNETLVLWRNPRFPGRSICRYNTSIILLTAGCRPDWYTTFTFDKAIEATKGLGGTDQAWVSVLSTPREACWTDADGIYGAGSLERGPDGKSILPDNARIVFTPGKRIPEMVEEKHPWMREHRLVA